MKTNKYAMEFKDIEQRQKFKSVAAQLGVTIKDLLIYSIMRTIIEFSRGNLTKNEVLNGRKV
jgi:hypothetical protein